MAMGKMSGIILLGLPAPFFLPSNVQYLFSPLPSLWIAKYFINNSIVSLLLAFLTLVLWYLLLVRKFERKIA
jgi:fluoroquinolone transport system permease protein